MTGTPLVAGISDHSGSAWLMSLVLVDGLPELVDRRREITLDEGLPRQPHHHEAVEIDLAEAETLVASVKASALARTRDALIRLAADMAPRYHLIGIARRADPVRPLPDTVAKIMRSHPAMHAADGVLYRRAFDQAAEALQLDVSVHPRGHEAEMAAAALNMATHEFEDLLKAMGKAVGPPWQKEHRWAVANGTVQLLSSA